MEIATAVRTALDNALANGHDLRGFSTVDVVADLQRYDADLEGYKSHRLIPHVERWLAENRPALTVYRNMWAGLTWSEVLGQRIEFEWLQEARDYAAKHGYSGIRVQYV